MILVIVLGAPLAAMAVFSLVVVYLSPLWIIASLLFAPFAGRMYGRAATAAGVQQDHRTLRRSGMIAAVLLIVPWVYMMRHLRDGERRTGSWVFHPHVHAAALPQQHRSRYRTGVGSRAGRPQS